MWLSQAKFMRSELSWHLFSSQMTHTHSHTHTNVQRLFGKGNVASFGKVSPRIAEANWLAVNSIGLRNLISSCQTLGYFACFGAAIGQLELGQGAATMTTTSPQGSGLELKHLSPKQHLKFKCVLAFVFVCVFCVLFWFLVCFLYANHLSSSLSGLRKMWN